MTKGHPYYPEMKKLVDRLLANSYELVSASDGEETYTNDEQAVIDTITSVDISSLNVRHIPTGSKTCLMIVLGNEYGCSVADYTGNDKLLETVVHEHYESY